MACVNISLVTDYDCGLVSGSKPVSHNEVFKVFAANIENLRKTLFTLIEEIPSGIDYGANEVLDTSRFV